MFTNWTRFRPGAPPCTSYSVTIPKKEGGQTDAPKATLKKKPQRGEVTGNNIGDVAATALRWTGPLMRIWRQRPPSEFEESEMMIWLVVSTPLKNMKVSWDDEIPNIWENKIDGNQTTNQMII